MPDNPEEMTKLQQLEAELAVAENGLMCADMGIDTQFRRSSEMERYRNWIESIEKQIKEIQDED